MSDYPDDGIVAEPDDAVQQPPSIRPGSVVQPLPPEEAAGLAPPVVEHRVYDDQGRSREVGLAPFVYVRAYHNMIGGFGLHAARGETEPVEINGKVFDRIIPETITNRDDCEGWIPNTEEAVRAVELGWAEVIDPPADAKPMPTPPNE